MLDITKRNSSQHHRTTISKLCVCSNSANMLTLGKEGNHSNSGGSIEQNYLDRSRSSRVQIVNPQSSKHCQNV